MHRLFKHINSFKYESKRKSTELLNFIRGKKNEKINVDLDWSNLEKRKPYCPAFKKMHVMLYREMSHYFLYKESVE